MKTMSFVTGNILFDGSPSFEKTAKIKILIHDTGVVGDKRQVYTKDVDFDADALAIFKYLPFEIKDFDFDGSCRYELTVHVDMSGNNEVESGDYVSGAYPIVTALEEIDVNLTQV